MNIECISTAADKREILTMYGVVSLYATEISGGEPLYIMILINK